MNQLPGGGGADNTKSRRSGSQQKRKHRRKGCPVAPRDFSSYFTEGSKFFRVGDMDKALECFKKVG